jgi:hypothetical protein
MQDTKAIRPEIKGLFELIRNQAVKYSEAFEAIEMHRNEYEIFINDLKKLNNELYVSINNEIFNLKQQFNDLIKLLKIENSRVVQKYSELQDLKSLQDSYFSALDSIKNIQISLEQQSINLKESTDDYKQRIDEIKFSADTKVDEFIKGALDKIDETVKSKYQSFEEKINSKLNQIDSKILNNDEVYFSFQEKYLYDLKRVLEEFDIFKKNMLNIELSRKSQDYNSILKKMISNHNDKFAEAFEKINELNDKFESLNSKFDRNNLPYLKNMKSESNSGNKNLINENKILNEFKNATIEIENKMKMSIIISVSSIVLAIVAIILSILI